MGQEEQAQEGGVAEEESNGVEGVGFEKTWMVVWVLPDRVSAGAADGDVQERQQGGGRQEAEEAKDDGKPGEHGHGCAGGKEGRR